MRDNPSYQDVWTLLKTADRAVVRVSKDYAPTLLNNVKCAKWTDNNGRRAVGLPPYPRYKTTRSDDDGVCVTITFEFPFSLKFL
jgi:hypothetical protein